MPSTERDRRSREPRADEPLGRARQCVPSDVASSTGLTTAIVIVTSWLHGQRDMQPDSHRRGAGGPAQTMAPNLDPATFVQLPRPGVYVANPAGTHAVVAVTKYDHEALKTHKSLRVISIPKEGDEAKLAARLLPHPQEKHNETAGEWEELEHADAEVSGSQGHAVVVDGLKYTDFVWADDATILYLRPAGAEPGIHDLDPTKNDKAADKKLQRRLEEMKEANDDQNVGIEVWAKVVGTGAAQTASKTEYKVGTLPTEVSDLKIHRSSDSTVLLGFSASVYAPYDVPSLFAVAKKEAEFERQQEGSSGQTYDGLFVRHWDEWEDQFGKRKQVFVAELNKAKAKANLSPGDTSWKLDSKDISAPLSKLENSVSMFRTLLCLDVLTDDERRRCLLDLSGTKVTTTSGMTSSRSPARTRESIQVGIVDHS